MYAYKRVSSDNGLRQFTSVLLFIRSKRSNARRLVSAVSIVAEIPGTRHTNCSRCCNEAIAVKITR